MKPLLKIVAVCILLGAAYWSVQASRRSAPAVTLTVVTNGAPRSSTNVVFRVANQGSRAILLTDLVVETDTPAGWREASEFNTRRFWQRVENNVCF